MPKFFLLIIFCINALGALAQDSLSVDSLQRMADRRSAYLREGRMEEYANISAEINEMVGRILSFDKLRIPAAVSADLYAFLGKEKEEGKDYDAAIGYYRKAIADGQDAEGSATCCRIERGEFLKVGYNLAYCLYMTDRFGEAMETIDLLYATERKLGLKTSDEAEDARTQIQVLCLNRQGKDDDALRLIEEKAKQIKESASSTLNPKPSTLNPQPSSYIRATPYQNAMMIYNNNGDFRKAIFYADKADSVLAIDQREDGDDRLTILLYKINAYMQLEEFEEAIRLSRYRMDLKRDIYRNDSAEYKKDVFFLAQVEAFSGVAGNDEDLKHAKEHIAEYARLEEKEIKGQAPWLTAAERDALWEHAQKTLTSITGFAGGLKAFNEPLDVEVYNAHLLASGLLLKTEKSMGDAITKYGTEEDKQELSRIDQLRDSLTEAIRENDMGKKAVYQIALQTAENRLLKRAATMPNCQSLLDADYEDIHSALKEGEVLVDFLEFTTQSGEDRIYAFIIRPEWKYPQLLRLPNREDIDAISETLDARMYEDSTRIRMRELLLDSILTYVKPGERIYYVPNGVLHGIAIENLVSEEYDIHCLSSAAEKITVNGYGLTDNGYGLTVNGYGLKTAVLYGGLSYGDYGGQELPQSGVGGLRPDGEERGIGDAFRTLSGTLAEVRNASATLKKSKVMATCYEKDRGSEETFMALDGNSPDIIHLATHGYYLSAERARKVAGLAGYTDAMLLSGLVMSGGNAGWLGIHTADGSKDGLLSAEDISKLDLSQTKLVVLSACKTASGHTSPEGIFGLQRAFKKAGAGTMIMTLWGVNDKVTAVFMDNFYKALVKQGWDKHEAFRTARRETRKQYKDPYYWAGFIMVD